jgi:hypothetical protein
VPTIWFAALIALLTASGALGGASATPWRRIALRLAGRLPTPAIVWAFIDFRAPPLGGANEPLVPAEAAGILDGSPRTNSTFGAELAERS